ncbi:MAG: hypothetical protein IPG74_16880 [Flavobacteriales bacterium]|nr:hypothetical protein [Flavobacteriales bacterium]
MDVTGYFLDYTSIAADQQHSASTNTKYRPMTRHLTIALLTATCALQAQVTVDWNQPVSGLAVALDQSNNVFTVNYNYALGGDITLIKRNSAGTELWQAFFDQTSTTMFDKATWVATDQAGNAIVTGTVMSGYSNPVNANSIVMKFSPSGTLLWRQVYETFFDGSYTKKCIVDKANNIYVFGVGTGPNGQVTKVKKFAPNGTALWSWFDPVGIGAPLNIKFTPDSNLVIVCRGTNANGYAKIDRNGNGIWSLAAVNSLTTGDAAGDAAGNTYCVNGEYPGGAASVIMKLSPTGAMVWQTPHAITAYRVEVGTDQAPVISGFPTGGGAGAAFLKADVNGALVWSNQNADGPNMFLQHAQMMMDQYDNAYLCAGTLFAMGICKVNSDGTTGWYVTTSSSGSFAFALGSDYNVYVTGGGTARLGQTAPAVVLLSPKVFLEGPFVPGIGLMDDALRTNGLIPLNEPYAALGYVHTGPAGGPTTAGVLSVAGNNAIVDWVLVELRDGLDMTSVIRSRSALVQRDGDVVDTDGTSPVPFAAPTGNYFVAIKHRNHLGCVTAVPLALSGNVVIVDLTSSGTNTYGTDARKVMGAWTTLWAGDATFNGELKYTGVLNDRDPILVRIGGVIPTNTVVGYFGEDTNLDGTVKYIGVLNDRDPILVNIGGVVPTNTRPAQLP